EIETVQFGDEIDTDGRLAGSAGLFHERYMDPHRAGRKSEKGEFAAISR
ncbi:MAG: hypothetical protein HN577_09155, partial [Rhodospirillaceae bacterium]|nr:hypothetical protein [Rhodospirillaceae bacterium]